jgi:hypothetical protein
MLALRPARLAVLLPVLLLPTACRAAPPEPTPDPLVAATSAATTPELGTAQSGFAAATTAPLAGPAAGGPVPSGRGVFRVAFRSAVDPIPINSIHEWTLHVETADGVPVEGAAIKVSGSMPAHRHGMPTEPKMTADLGGGDYRVDGMKFQMRGDWEIYVDVAAPDGQSDSATLMLVLP